MEVLWNFTVAAQVISTFILKNPSLIKKLASFPDLDYENGHHYKLAKRQQTISADYENRAALI